MEKFTNRTSNNQYKITLYNVQIIPPARNMPHVFLI